MKNEFEKYKLSDFSPSNDTLNSTQLNGNSLSTSTATTTFTTSTTLKQKNILSLCFDSIVNNIPQVSNPYQEIDDYLTADFNENIVGNNNSDDIDILLFWRQQQSLYPVLSSIAKVVYAIPASNTIIERLFSKAKNVVTEKRTRLDCEKINQILFLQKNMKTLKELSNNEFRRKRTASMSSSTTTTSSSATTMSSEESACTVPKQLRLDDDSFDEFSQEYIID